MVLLDTPRRRHSANRGWAIAAAALWVVAAALFVYYLWSSQSDASATALETTPTSAAALVSDPQSRAAATTTADTATTTTTDPPTTTTASTTTTTQQPTTTTTEPPPLTVAASGDVLGDRGPGLFMDKNGGEPLFAEVKPFLETAMLAFVNVEGPISNVGARASWKEYTFRGRPALADGLAYAGIDVISLANNHSVDYGTKALLGTFVRLDAAGVQYAGAGPDAASAAAPAMLITPAGMVACLAYTDIIPGGFTAGSETPGVNATTPDRKKLLAAVAAADEKADFVIVSFHWGEEYTGEANRDQRKLAHQVVDAGADLVLGHHPHVLQGLELYRNRLIAYSLGDFVWDHYRPVTGETVILQMTVPRAGPPSFEVVPIYLDEVTGVPAPVTGDHAASILGRLAGFSADLGLELTISGDRAYFEPALDPGAAAASTP
jgi:hypothetical protein